MTQEQEKTDYPRFEEINVDDIEPIENCRIKIDELEGLMADIRQRGLLQPLGVADKNEKGKYKLICGHRRYISVKKLGWQKIYVSILQSSEIDKQKFLLTNLAENIHRKDLSPYELGRVINVLNSDLNMAEIAARLNMPKSRVENALHVFKIVPEKFQHKVAFKGIRNKDNQGKLGQTMINILAIHSERLGLTKPQFEDVLQFAYDQSLNGKKAKLLMTLMYTKQLTAKKAIEYLDLHQLIYPIVLVKKEDLEKGKTLFPQAKSVCKLAALAMKGKWTFSEATPIE